jgi:hypothetical protein
MFRTRHENIRRHSLVVLVALLCLSRGANAQKAPKKAADMELPLSAEQTAQATGLLPLFNNLRELMLQPSGTNSLELLLRRQQVMLEVVSVSMQVDATTGEIDGEIAETRELENYLGTRRDSQVERVNLVSLAIGGVAGTASSALGLTVHDSAAAVTGIVAGSTTAILSLVGLRLAHGQKQELQTESNMLSELFDRPRDSGNVYSPAIATFMNSAAVNDEDGLTRQERLIREWVEVGRIPDPESEAGQEKITRLTSLTGENIKQSIADLDDRQAMLYDFRARLTHMKQDLSILLRSIPMEMPTPANTGAAPVK